MGVRVINHFRILNQNSYTFISRDNVILAYGKAILKPLSYPCLNNKHPSRLEYNLSKNRYTNPILTDLKMASDHRAIRYFELEFCTRPLSGGKSIKLKNCQILIEGKRVKLSILVVRV